MAFHSAHHPFLRLCFCLLHKAMSEREAEDDGKEDDHEQTAKIFCHHKLPAQKHDENDTQLNHEIGGGQFKNHRRGKASTFLKNGTSKRYRRVGARTGGNAKERGKGEVFRRVATKRSCHRLMRN
jgi:hypothetical protein